MFDQTSESRHAEDYYNAAAPSLFPNTLESVGQIQPYRLPQRAPTDDRGRERWRGWEMRVASGVRRRVEKGDGIAADGGNRRIAGISADFAAILCFRIRRRIKDILLSLGVLGGPLAAFS